ncbi:MAG: succinate dehydrogenase, cytochrome b556 subunit [Dehalococcoidales bacterium]|nr:succinate dehydrogenase, cytochrome b556 subunit [Dehalococcoidales bacterium]
MNNSRSRSWSWFAYYRGQIGQWAQLLHRLTGLGILAFLFLHIADTALVGFGPGVYDAVTAIYHNPIARVFEVILVGVVIYHAVNGTRVIIIDFWDRGALFQERLFWAMMVVFIILFVPSAYLMLTSVF